MKSKNSLTMVSVFGVITLALVISSDGLVRENAQPVPDTMEVRDLSLAPPAPGDNMTPIAGQSIQDTDGTAVEAHTTVFLEDQDVVATPVLMVWRDRVTGQWMSRQIEPGVKHR